MSRPESYKTERSYDTKQLPLVPTPSDHLVTLYDGYKEIEHYATLTRNTCLVKDNTHTAMSKIPN